MFRTRTFSCVPSRPLDVKPRPSPLSSQNSGGGFVVYVCLAINRSHETTAPLVSPNGRPGESVQFVLSIKFFSISTFHIVIPAVVEREIFPSQPRLRLVVLISLLPELSREQTVSHLLPLLKPRKQRIDRMTAPIDSSTPEQTEWDTEIADNEKPSDPILVSLPIVFETWTKTTGHLC